MNHVNHEYSKYIVIVSPVSLKDIELKETEAGCPFLREK